MIYDKGFITLNDGTYTHYSYSYNSKEALDIVFVSPDLGPSCKWKVQENIGSDHLPILIELKKRQSLRFNIKKLWNLKRADWLSFTTFIDNEISKNPLTEDLDTNWNTLKKIMPTAAKYNIPRSKMKNKRPYLTSNSPSLQPLLEERKRIVDVLNSNNNNQDRIELNKVNAELKRKYAQMKRDKWNELCTSLDSRSSNGKLWKLVKNIGKEQPQVEKCNNIKNRDGTVARDDGQAANILGLHYQNISKLTFIGEDRHIRSRVSDIAQGCRSNTQDSIPIFNRDFTLPELEAAIADLKLNKSHGPDGIHGRFRNKMGSIGILRFLDIINGSWKI
ncbi:hypothetical protein AVEN_148339-1 [Araneus ventricosus]|uniref:Endonuclease/exonuclease/phosphatase domain-containing protein n=1 Tax=Araneus ventricosus TaxID=182803 RepID=A0A4Y2UVL9_ARAVE|nr:hypothetical protein AVEN_95154-1 [Araneus ventricosus]GBO16876.1 hypothetical protein AVEN_148339-1 [Araneus ventricosus]